MLLRLWLASFTALVALAQNPGAPVVLENHEVFRIEAAFGPYSARDRAHDVSLRLRAIVERGRTDPVVTTYVPIENATVITTGGILVLTVLEADAKAAGKPRATHRRVCRGHPRRIEFVPRAAHLLELFPRLRSSSRRVVRVSRIHLASAARRRLAEDSHGPLGRPEGHLPTGSRPGRILWERASLLLFTAARVFLWIFILFQFSFLISYTFGLFRRPPASPPRCSITCDRRLAVYGTPS